MSHKGSKSDAMLVAKTLQEAGYQALLAGGCVRDLLLGAEPDDFDIATNATPKQIQKIFPKVLMIGAQFGVAMVIYKGRVIEVATFRCDLGYSDGRRPDAVEFSDARADAMRRDFTINGMFMNPLTEEIIDYVGGREDLQSGVIRAIGDADQRFAEDYLRMLRAVRFAARLNFSMDTKTVKAIEANADKLDKISGERIREELEKILARPNSRLAALRLIDSLGLKTGVFGDGFDNDLWKTAFNRLSNLDSNADGLTALACLFAGNSPANIGKRCRSWGASNSMRQMMLESASKLNLWQKASGDEMPLCDFKRIMASDSWPILLHIWQAEINRQGQAEVCFEAIQKRASQIEPEQVNPNPFVSGLDLIRRGLKEGPALGRILKDIYDMQLNEQLTTRSEAIAKAEEMLQENLHGPNV